MKKLVFFLAGLLLMASTVSAKPVDAAQARQVAETYMRAMGFRNLTALQDVTAQTPFTEFYIFAAADGGFILVSGDDCVIPVLGFSTTTLFPAKGIPENVMGWLEDYEKEIHHWKAEMSHEGLQVVGTDEEENPVARQWQLLTSGEMPAPEVLTAVSPLMSTTWGQSPLYNDLCPYDDDYDARVVTGCVATATAQIMKFWNHPTTGYGSHSYTATNSHTNYGTLSANFGATTYQWSNMPNALTNSSSTTQINAVATLMSHIGIADEMTYDVSSQGGSGAYNYNYYGTIMESSQTSLMKYFKYRADIAVMARADYSNADFATLMRAELDQSRPILFSGRHTSGGHSFVADGYNNAGLFHINWGWRSSYDGYFAVGALNPYGGGDGSNSSGTYNMKNVICTNIRPHTNWSTSGNTTVSTSTNGNGTVTGSGSYSFGSTVTLTAIPASGYRFAGWSDGTKFNPREIIANGGSYSFTANFVPLQGDTVTYCPGSLNVTNFGNSTSGSDKYWGIKIPASAIPTGKSLEKVMIYITDAGTYDMTIYTGSNHSTVAATRTMTFTSDDEDRWQTISLGNDMVNTTQDIWIQFHNTDVNYPAALTYWNGTSNSILWGTSFSEYGSSYHYTLMIKGIFRAGNPPVYSGDTISYCGNNAYSGYSAGNTGNNTLQWGINLSQADLAGYNYLKSVMLYVPTGYPGTYTVKIYQDGSDAPGTLVRTIPTTFTANQTGWQEVELSDYLALTGHNLWITVNTSGITYPMAYCAYNGSPNSDWYSFNNGTWQHFGQGTWMIKAVTQADNCRNLTSFPYTMNFEESESEALNCWEVRDVDNDGYAWTFYSDGYGYNNTRCMGIRYGAHNDDWLLTPVIATPGSYTLTWKTRIRSSTYPETYQILWYNETSSTQLFQETLSSTSYVDRTVNFTVPQGGSGRLVFRCISEDQYYLYIDNVVISQNVQPTQYTLTVTSNNSNWGTVTGGGTYNSGASATLTATPATGYHFVRWNDNNTQNPRTVTVTANATYTATFAVNTYTVTANSNNTNWGTVTGGGTYNYNTTATLTATPASGYRFVRWNDNNTQNPRTVTVTADATYTATFEVIPPTMYTLTVVSNNTNWGTVTGGGSYVDGSSATLTATAAEGYRFVQWNDGNTQNPRIVTVTGNATYTATFEVIPPTMYTLTVVSNNTNWGTVTGGGSYVDGSSATLTATAAEGYRFVQWNDGNTQNPRTVTVTGNATYTATFEVIPPTMYTLTVVSNNTNWGTVTGGGSYVDGSSATLTATAAEGYRFVQWNDGNTQNPRTVTVTGNATYTATFEVIPPTIYTLTVISLNPSWGTVTGGGQYTAGSTAILAATPVSGYRFAHWNDGNTQNPRSVTVTANAVYTATFELIPVTMYTLTVITTTPGWGTVSGGGTYEAGSTATLTATPANGYRFVCWSDGNTQNPRSYIVNSNAFISATFEALPPTIYTLTVLSNNNNWGTVSGSGQYEEGSIATISATAATGYHFVEWNDGNTQTPRAVTVNGNDTYTATFAVNTYTLTVSSANPDWGSVAGGGTFNHGATTSISATPATGYHFVEWNDGNTQNPRTVTMTNDASFTAIFAANTYLLTVSSNNPDWGTVTGGGTYNYNASATLTATPADGCRFVQWTDGNTQNTRTVTVTDNASYTATFELIPPTMYTVTVISLTPNWGNVAGGGQYEEGSTATLTATANDGCRFVAWNDGNTENPRNIIVTDDITYTATFEEIPPTMYTITVLSNNGAWGSVSGSGRYQEGSTASLTATANDGYRFVSWNDGDTQNPRTVTVTADASYTATFEAVPATMYILTVLSNNDAWGSVSGGGQYQEGDTATLVATPAEGYEFKYWNDGNRENPRKVAVFDDHRYVANFEAKVGIDDVFSLLSAVTLYPNPATSVVTITGIQGSAEISLSDLSGRTIYTQTLTTPSLTIDVSHLAQGTYFVRIANDSDSVIHKLIVK